MTPLNRLITLGHETVWGFSLFLRTLQSGGCAVTLRASARSTLELAGEHEVAEIYTVPSVAVDLIKVQRRKSGRFARP